MTPKARYHIFICPDCGEQFQFAGFCDSCQTRLASCTCLPVEAILRHRDKVVGESSEVPGVLISRFVESLLVCSGLPAG